MKKLKTTLLIATIVYSSLKTISFAAIDGGSSKNSNSSAYKNFSENSIGIGISSGLRFNIAENIFTDLENQNNKIKDHIFSEFEAFGNQFLSGEIKQNFGTRLNLGYEIYGVRIYSSGGYVLSNTSYKEKENSTQSIIASSPFFGVGIGYDITKNLGLRLNSMFYNFDFKPKNSEYKSVKIDVSSVNIGLAFHF